MYILILWVRSVRRDQNTQPPIAALDNRMRGRINSGDENVKWKCEQTGSCTGPGQYL